MHRKSPEFEIISQYFSKHKEETALELGVGDDGAVFNVPPEHSLVFSIDTLVEGRHFPLGFPAEFIAQRALGSALSDLAAMGASPSHFTLALTLPCHDAAWLSGFSKGLFSYAHQYDVVLAGGDTTKGPLTVSIQVHGVVPTGQHLTRSGAKANDLLFASNNLGDAAGGLSIALNQQKAAAHYADLSENEAILFDAFVCPTLNFEMALGMRSLANACIDVSDGLLADAEQLARASNLTVCVDTQCLPISSALREEQGASKAVQCALSGGDDYALLFSVPPTNKGAAKAAGLIEIGRFIQGDPSMQGAGVKLFHDGHDIPLPSNQGFDHFV